MSTAPITVTTSDGVSTTYTVSDGQTITLQNKMYTVTAGAVNGYTAPTSQSVNLTNGNATVTLNYTKATSTDMPSGAFYVDGDGKMVAITPEDLKQAGSRFVFYAWLENKDGGVTPATLGSSPAPTSAEQQEVAPLGTQNLTAGYVGYRGPNGQVYPVIGAAVRWDINESKDGTNIRIATADDGAVASGAIRPQDVNDNAMSATTFTNRATGSNAQFPSSPDYPLNNVTGVNTADTDGFTWTALWVPSSAAGVATVTAVAEVNGTEINKAVLTKRFAPSAKLTITKVSDQSAGLNQDRTFTITVTNIGNGPANNIMLNDRLQSGAEAAYSITAPDDGTVTPVGDSGFDATPFNLAPGESRTISFPARASATGVYCDLASVTSYDNGPFGTVTPGDLQDDACLTVTAPELTIIKTLVDAQGNILPSGTEVAPNQEVRARITVTNGGSAPATNVVVTDALTSGQAANYAIQTPPQDAALNGDDGFTSTPFDLAPGASKVFTFGASATADGTYCDTGSFSAISNNGQELGGTSDDQCFVVTSPLLTIAKTNSQISGQPATNSLTPGSSYSSTITVTNTGTAAATAVAVSDLLGRLTNGTQSVNFGSGNYVLSNGAGGTISSGALARSANDANSIVTAPATLSIPAGATLTLQLTSSIPAGAPVGEYCDVASFTSGNAGTGNAQDCVTVVSFISEQTQITDQSDPVRPGGTTGVISAAIVEPSSNEGAVNNVLIYNFGTTDPVQQTPGIFDFANSAVYYDPSPVRDPQTGVVTSDYTTASSRQLSSGSEFTVDNASGTGQQTITLDPTFRIAPGGVIFVRTEITAPVGTAPRQYFTTYRWNNVAESARTTQTNFSSESTTVIP
ncbi:DUF11 domain-containing protein [Deinococcus aerophilus]|uniref:DUF11 domain-containing protein n=1 Tax=Deinococcus aerophilus TaxID=522488 RepID=UPI001E3A87D0|nr:DUF11 domain-containing protein [Deinococcus aerophilus]